MINGTGMIETDKLILQIVKHSSKNNKKMSKWKSILKKNKVPKNFFKVSKPFLSPNFSYEKSIKEFNFDDKSLDNLDFLLWKWKCGLSQEWYQYLLSFKHDLQISKNELSLNRILKTQTQPMQIQLRKRSDFK